MLSSLVTSKTHYAKLITQYIGFKILKTKTTVKCIEISLTAVHCFIRPVSTVIITVTNQKSSDTAA